MQRSSIIGDIYGYLVCLLAIVIFVHSAAGFVNSAFGFAGARVAAHGFPAPMMMIAARQPGGGMRIWSGGMRPPWTGGMYRHRGPGAVVPPNPAATLQPGAPNVLPTVTVARMRPHGPIVRGLVLDLILMILAVLLFRWHWRWLQRTQPA